MTFGVAGGAETQFDIGVRNPVAIEIDFGNRFDEIYNIAFGMQVAVSESFTKSPQALRTRIIAKNKFLNRISLREFNFFNACISIAKSQN